MVPVPGAVLQPRVSPVRRLPQLSFTVAVKSREAPASMSVAEGVRVTWAAGPGTMVTVALAVTPLALVAVTAEVTVPGVQEAVSTPVLLMVPTADGALQVKTASSMGVPAEL